jgi:hypothetical protein
MARFRAVGVNRMKRLMLAAAVTTLSGVAMASTVLGLSIEDQARLSTHVVVAEVLTLEGVDHPENGLETAVTVRVLRSLKGDVAPGGTLTFHTRSGELDGEISEAIGEAVFRPGQRTLVFVESIDGRLYNIGLSYGVFDVREDARGRVSFVRAIQDGLDIVGDGPGDGPFSMEEIAARVAYTRKNPRFDNPMVREAFGEGR